MIKRIIFDLDNTLIMWKNEYKDAIKKTIEDYKLDVDYLLVDEVIEEYEKYYDKYQKDLMINLINKKFNLNLGVDFIDKWLYELRTTSEVDNELIEVLKYLNQKYELVVLTNWFIESQLERLKNASIDTYFKEIIGGDNFIKPSPLSFDASCGNLKKEECLMVGDNYETDIIGALNYGIKAIMITNKNIENKNIKIIRNIKELKEIL